MTRLLALLACLLYAVPVAAQMPPADICGQDAVKAGETRTLTGDVTLTTLHSLAGSILRVVPPATITITDTPPCDPAQFATGLILEGRVEIAGTHKTAWSRLTAGLRSGAVQAIVTDAAGWLVGDRLIVADTREFERTLAEGRWQPEIVTITAVAGTAITFTPALTHDVPCRMDEHAACDGTFGVVGNLTRDMVIRSANPAGTRGHLMITGGATGSITDVALVDLGRTQLLVTAASPRGRYCGPHLHMLTTPGFVVDGLVTECHLGAVWGPTIHGTAGQIVRHTVTVGTLGAGLMTEDGTESQNVIDDNLVVGVAGDGDRGDGGPDAGRNGSCVWLQGQDNIVRHNVAADCQFGYSVFGGTRFPGEPRNLIPLRVFEDNEAVGTQSGLVPWYLKGGGTILRFTSWHHAQACVTAYPTDGLAYVDLVCRSDPRQLAGHVARGFDPGDYGADHGILIRPDIRNAYVGIFLPNRSGLDGFTVDHPRLANYVDVLTVTPYQSGGHFELVQPTRNRIVSPTHLAPFPVVRDSPRVPYQRWLNLEGGANLLSQDDLLVFDYQGTGANYRILYAEQAPGFVIPAHASTVDVVGLTNTQAWAKAGKAIAGSVAPSEARSVPWVTGLIVPLDSVAPDPPVIEPAPDPAPVVVPVPDPPVVQPPVLIPPALVCKPQALTLMVCQ